MSQRKRLTIVTALCSISYLALLIIGQIEVLHPLRWVLLPIFYVSGAILLSNLMEGVLFLVGVCLSGQPIRFDDQNHHR